MLWGVDMNKDYNIMLTEENTKLGVYIIPHGVKITDKSLFRIRIGFIDLDEDHFDFIV